MKIDAANLDFEQLNKALKNVQGDSIVDNCLGQRFIGVKRNSGKLTLNGTPGNALGAYLDGAVIEVFGNAQDAVGDTMNDGKIIIHGSAGDALGLAMRGGEIYVKENAGYRAGIHMKEYQEKKPVIVIGGSAGSFLGEYMAGGLIIVLGLGATKLPLKNFTGTGMHGGKMIVRTKQLPEGLPPQVSAAKASMADLQEILPYLTQFSALFTISLTPKKEDFFVLKPNAKNPYTKLYTEN
ncbi:MAG: glutamate synthase [Firmicutes bacterium]|nr:glutamate synthase [Bacillota bacterium]